MNDIQSTLICNAAAENYINRKINSLLTNIQSDQRTSSTRRRRFITKSANNYKTVHYLQKVETQT